MQDYESDRWRIISTKVGNGFSAAACKAKAAELRPDLYEFDPEPDAEFARGEEEQEEVDIEEEDDDDEDDEAEEGVCKDNDEDQKWEQRLHGKYGSPYGRSAKDTNDGATAKSEEGDDDEDDSESDASVEGG